MSLDKDGLLDIFRSRVVVFGILFEWNLGTMTMSAIP